MRILFRTECEDLKEWCILELQGTISSPISTTLHGMSLGKMNFDKDGRPILTIGNNVLTGNKQKLRKPWLITSKKAVDTTDGKKQLNVLAIVKSKIVFKHRPKIVLMNSSPSNKKLHLSQIK
eukprot:53465_1